MRYEKEILTGLKKASSRSKRDGKWATVSEVRDYSKRVPFDTKIRPVLMQLVKENRAEKKREEELWRPVGLGGGGIGSLSGEGKRGEDGGRTPYPDITNVPEGDRNGNPKDTVGAAVGIMFAGGLGGGGTPGTPNVPSVR